MQCMTDPLLVMGYGCWENDAGEPMTNKAGEIIEWVQLVDQETNEVLKVTMRGVNGDRPPALSFASVKMGFTVDRKGGLAKGKDGNEYEVIRERLKPSVLGFGPVADVTKITGAAAAATRDRKS